MRGTRMVILGYGKTPEQRETHGKQNKQRRRQGKGLHRQTKQTGPGMASMKGGTHSKQSEGKNQA